MITKTTHSAIQTCDYSGSGRVNSPTTMVAQRDNKEVNNYPSADNTPDSETLKESSYHRLSWEKFHSIERRESAANDMISDTDSVHSESCALIHALDTVRMTRKPSKSFNQTLQSQNSHIPDVSDASHVCPSAPGVEVEGISVQTGVSLNDIPREIDISYRLDISSDIPRCSDSGISPELSYNEFVNNVENTIIHTTSDPYKESKPVKRPYLQQIVPPINIEDEQNRYPLNRDDGPLNYHTYGISPLRTIETQTYPSHRVIETQTGEMQTAAEFDQSFNDSLIRDMEQMKQSILSLTDKVANDSCTSVITKDTGVSASPPTSPRLYIQALVTSRSGTPAESQQPGQQTATNITELSRKTLTATDEVHQSDSEKSVNDQQNYETCFQMANSSPIDIPGHIACTSRPVTSTPVTSPSTATHVNHMDIYGNENTLDEIKSAKSKTTVMDPLTGSLSQVETQAESDQSNNEYVTATMSSFETEVKSLHNASVDSDIISISSQVEFIDDSIAALKKGHQKFLSYLESLNNSSLRLSKRKEILAQKTSDLLTEFMQESPLCMSVASDESSRQDSQIISDEEVFDDYLKVEDVSYTEIENDNSLFKYNGNIGSTGNNNIYIDHLLGAEQFDDGNGTMENISSNNEPLVIDINSNIGHTIEDTREDNEQIEYFNSEQSAEGTNLDDSVCSDNEQNTDNPVRDDCTMGHNYPTQENLQPTNAINQHLPIIAGSINDDKFTEHIIIDIDEFLNEFKVTSKSNTGRCRKSIQMEPDEHLDTTGREGTRADDSYSTTVHQESIDRAESKGEESVEPYYNLIVDDVENNVVRSGKDAGASLKTIDVKIDSSIIGDNIVDQLVLQSTPIQSNSLMNDCLSDDHTENDKTGSMDEVLVSTDVVLDVIEPECYIPRNTRHHSVSSQSSIHCKSEDNLSIPTEPIFSSTPVKAKSLDYWINDVYKERHAIEHVDRHVYGEHLDFKILASPPISLVSNQPKDVQQQENVESHLKATSLGQLKFIDRTSPSSGYEFIEDQSSIIGNKSNIKELSSTSPSAFRRLIREDSYISPREEVYGRGSLQHVSEDRNNHHVHNESITKTSTDVSMQTDLNTSVMCDQSIETNLSGSPLTDDLEWLRKERKRILDMLAKDVMPSKLQVGIVYKNSNCYSLIFVVEL